MKVQQKLGQRRDGLKKIAFVLAGALMLTGIFTGEKVEAKSANLVEIKAGSTLLHEHSFAFLGLRAWNEGVNFDEVDGEEKLKESIWKIVFNIATLVLQIMGYIAVLIIAYGGFLYLISAGDPGKAEKGRKTIVNAVIGLALAMSASIVTSIVVDVAKEARAGSMSEFITSILNRVFLWAGIIAGIMVVYGGISYTKSVGEPAKVQKARQTLVFAAIGLAIVLLSAAIVNLIAGTIK